MFTHKSEIIQLTVLSKSRKSNNYCVAGLDQNNNLVRLISDDISINNAIEIARFSYENGDPIELGDVIEVEVYEKNQLDELQPENRLVKEYTFRNIGTVSFLNLMLRATPLIDYPFYNDEYYVSHEELIEHIHHDIYSLMLVHANTLTLRVNESENHNKALVGSFYFGLGTEEGQRWCNYYRITDMAFIDKYYDKVKESTKGSITIRNVVLTLSLGEEYFGNHYKLIAAVFENDKR